MYWKLCVTFKLCAHARSTYTTCSSAEVKTKTFSRMTRTIMRRKCQHMCVLLNSSCWRPQIIDSPVRGFFSSPIARSHRMKTKMLLLHARTMRTFGGIVPKLPLQNGMAISTERQVYSIASDTNSVFRVSMTQLELDVPYFCLNIIKSSIRRVTRRSAPCVWLSFDLVVFVFGGGNQTLAGDVIFSEHKYAELSRTQYVISRVYLWHSSLGIISTCF